ncbi:helix-turn-helix domain-containing protein [Agrobacterium pusense]
MEEAFGFSLALLLARSAEVEAFAAQRLENENSYGSPSSARPFADATLPG